jgi:hypothetical protein
MPNVSYEQSSVEKNKLVEKTISPEQFKQSLIQLNEIVVKEPLNIIIADATEVGAGHSRQGKYLEDLFHFAELDKFTTRISIDMSNKDNTGPLMQLINYSYAILQNHPHLYYVVLKILNSPRIYPIIDDQLRFSSPKKQLLESMTNSPNYNEKRPTLFITTHVSLEEASTQLINEGLVIPKGIIATVPDPWEGQALVGMTAPDNLQKGKHNTIVHDQNTYEEFKRVRPNKKTEVMSLGTISDPYFLLKENKNKSAQKKLHLAIEFSGNRIPKVDKLFLNFIQSINEQLFRNEINLTIHAMNHDITTKNILKELDRLGLSDHIGNDNKHNIRIVYNNNLQMAINTRTKYIRGTLDKDWDTPDIIFSKGGEVPLEDRGQNQLIVGIYGGGHEGVDIETGVRENRAVDFRKIPTKEWYSKALEFYRDKANQNREYHQSIALLAPLEFLKPGSIAKLKQNQSDTNNYNSFVSFLSES